MEQDLPDYRPPIIPLPVPSVVSVPTTRGQTPSVLPHQRGFLKRRRTWAWFALGLFLIGIIFVVPLVYGGSVAIRAVLHLQGDVKRVQEQATAQDFVAVAQTLHAMREELQTLRRGIRILGPWRFVPSIGTQIQAMEDAGRAAGQTLVGVEELVIAITDVQAALTFGQDAMTRLRVPIGPSFRRMTPNEKRTALVRIADAIPRMRLARERLAIAMQAWRRIPENGLYAPFRDALSVLIRRFEILYAQLDEGMRLAEIVLPLAGYPTPKTYLFILQNAEEIRPTGGFIGNVGVVHVDAAELSDLSVKDVYAIDRPVADVWQDVPPEPLQRWLEQKNWFFRDSNWSPDFPTTAERLLDVYQREIALVGATSSLMDGVFAMQPGFFRALLHVTGPIQVEGKIFTAENFFDQLQYETEIGFIAQGTPRPQRKEIVAKVGQAVVEAILDLPSSTWPDLLRIWTRALEEKDLLLYVRDPSALALLDERRWSGRVRPSGSDYLWVVDANVGARKTDGVMEKQIFYTLDATADGGPVARVHLRYTNTNKTPDWRYTRYRDYVRIYVPEGSVLLSSSGAMEDDRSRTDGFVRVGTVDTMRDLGKTVFGAFWAIEPGETRDLVLTYRLPTILDVSSAYDLVVQKQPGAETRLTMDLLFGKNVVSASPAEDPSQFGDTRFWFTTPVQKDLVYTVHF